MYVFVFHSVAMSAMFRYVAKDDGALKTNGINVFLTKKFPSVS